MTTPSGRQLELLLGDQHATVVEVGGGLRTYSVAGRPVLDGYPAEAMADGARGQVLAPWPNRIEDGRYSFDEREHQLSLSEPAAHNAIHGLVRWVSWDVVEREPHRVLLTHLLHPQPGYPFLLRLSVDYSLAAAGLTVATSATNEGDQACPYGTGAHPYLRVADTTLDTWVLRAPARQVLIADERGIPRSRRPVAGTPYDFQAGRAVGDLVVDHGFTDLARAADGRATVTVTDPASGRALELWMDASYRHLMVFTGDTLAPDRRRHGLAPEPMTCPPNAFQTGEDLIRLEPGASVTATWGLRELRPG
ncbi:MAG TPA: aldose 1-epimerase family protein [Candidatus Limnocylindria bacterium]|nr:aldose 1-epimerase family protein [Candidatus Limnocylindria bacterium]